MEKDSSTAQLAINKTENALINFPNTSFINLFKVPKSLPRCEFSILILLIPTPRHKITLSALQYWIASFPKHDNLTPHTLCLGMSTGCILEKWPMGYRFCIILVYKLTSLPGGGRQICENLLGNREVVFCGGVWGVSDIGCSEYWRKNKAQWHERWVSIWRCSLSISPF